MKLLAVAAASAALAASCTQATVEDAEYDQLAQEFQECFTSTGLCMNRDAGEVRFEVNSEASCNDIDLFEWIPTYKNGAGLKTAIESRDASVGNDVKQIMLARVSTSTPVSSDKLSTSLSTVREDYLRCPGQNKQEYLYLYGTRSEVKAAMDASELSFSPETPLTVPDTLKISASIRTMMNSRAEGARDPNTSFSILIQLAKHDDTSNMSKDITGSIQSQLNDNRRRRRRLQAGEKMTDEIVVRKMGRTLIADNIQDEDLQLNNGNLALADMPGVMFLERKPEMSFENLDSALLVQSQTSLNANEAVDESKLTFWNNGVTGNGQIVGVADTGVNTEHCAFKDAAQPLKPSSGENVYTGHRKFTNYNAFVDGSDENGHGSHVAGSVAGDGGVLTQRGVAYDAKVSIYDFGDPRGGLRLPDTMGEIFEPTKAVGGFIHTNSWGDTGTRTYGPSARGVDEYSNDNQDFLILFAAGNSGRNSIGVPGLAKNCLTIGAQQNSNRAKRCSESGSPFCTDNMASFSSSGQLWDGRVGIDMVAIGDPVKSVRSSSTCSYVNKSGTSMATPVAAGAAALVRQYLVDGYYPTGNKVESDGFKPNGSLIKAAMINGGKYLKGKYRGQRLTQEPDNIQGFGSVHLSSNMPVDGNEADVTNIGLFMDGDFNNKRKVATGESVEYTFDVNAAADHNLKVTLVWHDPPAAVSASRALINDLDLTVTSDSGETFYPNSLSQADRVNNVEQINLKKGEHSNGVYTVTIKGETVPQGPQVFSLVVSGGFTASTAPAPTTPSPTAPTTLSPTNSPTIEPEVCKDVPEGWYDSDGATYNCVWYGQQGRCAQYGDRYENQGTVANKACCSCGGGSTGNSNQSVLDEKDDKKKYTPKDSKDIVGAATDNNNSVSTMFAVLGVVAGVVVGAVASVFIVTKNKEKKKAVTKALNNSSNPTFA